jgi:hypothetical protein
MAANIFCVVCGARPYPPPGFREDFDLMKLSSAGRPAEGGEGEWYLLAALRAARGRGALVSHRQGDRGRQRFCEGLRLWHDWRPHPRCLPLAGGEAQAMRRRVRRRFASAAAS